MYHDFKNHKRKDTIKWIVVFVLIALLICGVTCICVSLANNNKTKTLGTLDYEIGALDETGKYVKDTSSIVSKKYLSVDDMKIEIKKDANVTYKVYFFDKNEKFISADSAANSADYVGTVPENATLFKVVITPTKDAEVSTLEIDDYAKQLTVTYAK